MAPMSETTTPAGDPAAAEALAEAAAQIADRPEPVPAKRHSLWRHADYMRLWTAASISLLGSQVSLLAIPYIATVVLKASPLEVALLGAVEMAPFILLALPAGAWLDRVRRRPVLIAGDIGRGLALLTIPIAYAAGVLTIWQLYAVGFITGSLTVLFDVADQSYLPALLERDDLVEGNAKLQLPQSSATILGPGIGGGLIGLVGAPFAVVADAISFFVSGGLISRIRKHEPRPERRVTESGSQSSIGEDIREGLEYVLGNPYLRMIGGSTATCNLGTGIAFSIFPVFAYRELGLSALLVGTVLGAGGFGLLLGALTSERLSRRIGVGPAIVGSMFLMGPAMLLYALMPSDPLLAAALLFGSIFLSGFTGVVYNVNQVSFRQAITPLDIQGRMNATMRFIVWGTLPLGSLIGGLLASFLPLRTTILFGGAVTAVAFLWVLFSPVRSLRTIPAQESVGMPRP
jgi:MFS family permease